MKIRTPWQRPEKGIAGFSKRHADGVWGIGAGMEAA